MKKFYAFVPHDSILLHMIITTSYIIISLSRYSFPRMSDDLSCSSPHMCVITLFSNLRIRLQVDLFNLELSRTGSRATVLSTSLLWLFFGLRYKKGCIERIGRVSNGAIRTSHDPYAAMPQRFPFNLPLHGQCKLCLIDVFARFRPLH